MKEGRAGNVQSILAAVNASDKTGVGPVTLNTQAPARGGTDGATMIQMEQGFMVAIAEASSASRGDA